MRCSRKLIGAKVLKNLEIPQGFNWNIFKLKFKGVTGLIFTPICQKLLK